MITARTRIALGAIVVFALRLHAQPGGAIPSPEAHFGFRMGTDRRLAAATDIERYFQLTAASSDRVRLVDLGATTEGHPTLAAIISAPENIRNLEQIRSANQRLADPRTLSAAEAAAIVDTHKVVVAIGCSIHATEIGASQAANELLFRLVTDTDRATLDELRNVVVILIPMLNPDGYRLVADWYDRHRGTRLEGSPMPWGDHKYAGHDINRDAFMMNMAENRNLARFFYTDWHPQVFLSMHQMETDGPRFFAPPNEDPIQPNYDPVIWREAGLLGSAMTFALQSQGRSGVVSNALYDYYWPGYEDSAPLGHNTVCLLTEAARVNVASPVNISPAELRGGQKGLRTYQGQINFPDPWPGGHWTLRDIVDYDLIAAGGLLRAAATYRRDIVQNFYDMGRRAIELGGGGDPFAFVIAPDQHDAVATEKLEDVLLRAGVDIQRTLEPFRADGEPYPAGSDVILLAQPYRAYVKTLLEQQAYPGGRPLRDGSLDRPYDVTGWTLPAQMGVDVRTIQRSFEPPAMARLNAATIAAEKVWGERKPSYYVVENRGNAGALAANRLLTATSKLSWLAAGTDANGYHYEPGALVVPATKATQTLVNRLAGELGLRVDAMRGKVPAAARPLSRPRIAVYRPWVEVTDEGWTRWVLEQYEFPYKSVANADIRSGDLKSRFDVVILPSASAELLIGGQSTDLTPAEYAGGLGEDGVHALVAFVQAGGTLICLDQSGGLAIAAFHLPVRDVARESDDRFYCPGSIVRLELDATQPLSYGMQPRTAGFFSFSSAYELTEAGPPSEGGSTAPPVTQIASAARYADRNVLVSGWLEGEQVIAGRHAALQFNVAAGHVVLLGFRVQHRGQSLATFRLLFNAIHFAR